MRPKRKWKRPSASSSGSADPEATSQPSEQELYDLALKALTSRPYSSRELEDKLLQCGGDSTCIGQVIERLKTASYLDDRKYIELFIQSRRERKTHGRFRVARELLAKGLDPSLVQNVLDEAYPATQERAPLRLALEKKLRTLPAPMDAKKLARLYNHLLRCGFSVDAIRRELESRFDTDWQSEELG
jgi:regulatory protein